RGALCESPKCTHKPFSWTNWSNWIPLLAIALQTIKGDPKLGHVKSAASPNRWADEGEPPTTLLTASDRNPLLIRIGRLPRTWRTSSGTAAKRIRLASSCTVGELSRPSRCAVALRVSSVIVKCLLSFIVALLVFCLWWHAYLAGVTAHGVASASDAGD